MSGPALEISKWIHETKYRQRGETFREAISRVANTLADDPQHFYALRDILLSQSFLPAGRVQTAVGSPRKATSFNCFVSDTINDSLASIMKRAGQAAQTMRMGGGIGYDFSGLRPKGDIIVSLDSKSSGPLSFMQIYDSVCKTVASAGNRRGAQMGILRVDHPDIEEFIEAKTNKDNLTQFNISVAITDEFMRAVQLGIEFELKFNGRVYKRVDANYLWDKIMRATWDWAEPGVIYIDRVNEMNNLYYCETIAATNPCISKGTLVATPDGFIPVENINCGDSIVTISGIGQINKVEHHKNIPTYRVCLSDGTELCATKDHIFHVTENKWFNKERTLKELCVGDKVRLAPSHMPTNRIIANPFKNKSDRDYGLIIGATIGDGCYTNKSKILKIACGIDEELWMNKLIKKIPDSYISKSTDSCKTVCSTTALHCLDESPLSRGYSHEKYLPLELLNTNENFLAGYIDGYVSTDGNVHMSKTNPMIRVSSCSKESLTMLKRALSCFGILARIYLCKDKSVGKYTKIEGRKVYFRHQSYVLVILGEGVRTFADKIQLSHPTKQERMIRLVSEFSLTGCTWTASIVSIEYDKNNDVYDLYEPTSDTWITEGVVNRGCGEQPLPPNGACLLGSFNLVKYIGYKTETKPWQFDWEKFEQDIPIIIRAMDNIIDRTTYPLSTQEVEAKSKRRMGIGVTGLANAGEAMGYSYGSEEFIKFTNKVLRILANKSYQASALLAEEKGSFPAYDKDKYLQSKYIKKLSKETQTMIEENGIRNSHLISIAPTGTISLSADNVSSGIEPVFSYSYERTIQAEGGEIKETVEDYGHRVFGIKGKTANECTVQEHLAVLTAASRWSDSAVSKTLNVGADVPWDEFKGIYMQAWENGCKGCTTFRATGERYGILNETKVEEIEGACYIDVKTGVKECG